MRRHGEVEHGRLAGDQDDSASLGAEPREDDRDPVATGNEVGDPVLAALVGGRLADTLAVALPKRADIGEAERQIGGDVDDAADEGSSVGSALDLVDQLRLGTGHLLRRRGTSGRCRDEDTDGGAHGSPAYSDRDLGVGAEIGAFWHPARIVDPHMRARTHLATLAAIAACLAAIAASGCSDGDAGRSSDGPAGTVVRVAGEVIATRGAEAARVLVVGDRVHADDQVATGAAGEVAITLGHNGATLVLGPSASRRIDATLAWKAEPGSSSGGLLEQPPDDRTAAAGRHSEGEAADDPNTAVESAQPTPPPMEAERPTGGPPGGGGGPGGTDSYVDGDLGDPGIGVGGLGRGRGGGGAGYGAGKGGGLGVKGSRKPRVRLASPTVRGNLSKDIVRRYVRRNLASIRFCYEKSLVNDDSLAGRVELKFVISESGAIENPEAVSGAINDQAMLACLRRRAATWRFPRPVSGTVSVRYPLVFAPD